MHIKSIGKTQIALLVVISLLLGSANANVGVGVSVAIPLETMATSVLEPPAGVGAAW